MAHAKYNWRSSIVHEIYYKCSRLCQTLMYNKYTAPLTEPPWDADTPAEYELASELSQWNNEPSFEQEKRWLGFDGWKCTSHTSITCSNTQIIYCHSQSLINRQLQQEHTIWLYVWFVFNVTSTHTGHFVAGCSGRETRSEGRGLQMTKLIDWLIGVLRHVNTR